MKIPQECCVTLGVLLKTNGFISPLIAARGYPSSNPNRHKEIHWQKWLFTASHGARMLRESNPQITTVDQHMEMRAPKPAAPKADAPKTEVPKKESPKAEAPTANATPNAETPKIETKEETIQK